MRLTASQIERFEEDGFLILPGLFSPQEVAVLRDAMPALCAEDTPANIREKGSREVRTAMGIHLRHPAFAKLARHPRLIEPAFQLRGERLYIQQAKVNTKPAFEGEVWQWHYDFATHHAEDGVPEPLALNLHVFLDDVVDFNGPLYFIPGSHRHGPAPARLDTETTSYPLWVVDRDTVARLVAARGLVAATGAAGTALIFGDCLVHASPSNLSPWDRRIFSVIVNPIANALTRHDRPDWKHHRDLTPIVPLADDCLAAAPAIAAQ
ncbi:MAG TPA: phytanoyl-CoA dioxygenase family protein [Stellaceae bacterium]|nr:phytanoyl-CoA dioxygenase family protein [Stellaceae bacterium]